MRFVVPGLVALLLGACGARASGGPAWPKPSERETDGGESIAPHESTAIAVVDSDDDEEAAVVAPAATATATPTPGATTTTTPTPAPTITAPEDTITIEEIVIEISDE